MTSKKSLLSKSLIDQKLCQFFFHCDVIFDKLSKLRQISCVIPYYIEIKESLQKTSKRFLSNSLIVKF